jgi:hypothetical protein
MKILTTLSTALVISTLSSAQNVTVPTTCTGNFSAGTDEVLYTVPYTYDQVMSIIGSYKNLTWSGNPPNTVMLNGSDNTVGTARTYHLDGLTVIETILKYSKPPAPGPYDEVHNTALINAGPLSFYIPYDGTTVTEYCNGKASQFNFTAHFCSNNITAAGGLLHKVHLGDAVTVGQFLGGKNFTNCAALGESGATAPPTASTTATMTSSGGSGASSSTSSGLAVEPTIYAAGLGAALMPVVGAMLIL